MDERGDGGAGNEEGEEGEQWGEEDGEWEEEANGDNEEWILCDECQMGPPSSGESRAGDRGQIQPALGFREVPAFQVVCSQVIRSLYRPKCSRYDTKS